ncbi:MAG: 4-hydroxy-3-methylbut-2-en-1-yl diphosphate synthase [Tannerella sp.]|jgi:(E)-4-hydroxy-3-methylbut-2-enyl-diphosphate synthase|nr:4-hydroxy-3-methylbut-2-en-1-yl diphosphate synthase [Tannerella sp.]
MMLRYQRRPSSVVRIGNTPLGGDYPVRIQSMASVSTMDTEAAVGQAVRMIEAGAEYVRFTAQGEREAHQLGVIRAALRAQGYHTPLVADIHFNPQAAGIAAANVEKVRINPGNYVDGAKSFKPIVYTEASYAAELRKIRERFVPLLERCKSYGTAIRLGVNHGSLSDRILSRYGDTPEGMVASCMEYLRICREERFPEVVLSIKASNTVMMVQTVRLLAGTMEAEEMHYPLHLGVTEAGDGEDGRIRSAVGIGSLLADGLGDTLRVSLSEPPEAEIPVARKLTRYIGQREGHAPIAAPAMRRPGFARATHAAGSIGGTGVPVVISDHSLRTGSIDPANRPDFIYLGANRVGSVGGAGETPRIVDVDSWEGQPGTYPYFRAGEMDRLSRCSAALKFVECSGHAPDNEGIRLLGQDPSAVIVWDGRHPDYLNEARALVCRLRQAHCDTPLILRRRYREPDRETLQLQAAVDFGALLLDGIGNGLMLSHTDLDPGLTDSYLFSILQAVRLRVSKTEYISCPGCGRTRYDLQTTLARVKAATSHLKGLKIAVMGCIVNGPGEMADADYGYVGAGRERVNLYKGRECRLRNIPEQEAVQQLVQLIQESGDWK